MKKASLLILLLSFFCSMQAADVKILVFGFVRMVAICAIPSSE